MYLMGHFQVLKFIQNKEILFKDGTEQCGGL